MRFITLPLHVDALDDDLDDPVGLGDALEIVGEVAQPHPLGDALGKQRIGRQLLRGFPRLLYDAVVRPLTPDVGRRHVEQVDGQSGVGEMGGNLRAHRARAQNGGVAERRIIRGVIERGSACFHRVRRESKNQT